MQMIRSGDNRKTQLLSQLDQKNFFSVGRTEREVSGGVKLVWRKPKKEELLKNGCREEIRIHMTGTGRTNYNP